MIDIPPRAPTEAERDGVIELRIEEIRRSYSRGLSKGAMVALGGVAIVGIAVVLIRFVV